MIEIIFFLMLYFLFAKFYFEIKIGLFFRAFNQSITQRMFNPDFPKLTLPRIPCSLLLM